VYGGLRTCGSKSRLFLLDPRRILNNSPQNSCFFRLEGSHTRTDVVLAVAKMCLDAGAKELVSLCPLAPGFWQRSRLWRRHLSTKPALGLF